MPILAAELELRSPANVPTDDVSTAGGAISATSRPTLDQFTATAVAAVVSDGADARNVTVTGRLASGVVDTEVLALNGAVEVVGVKQFERVHSVVLSATSGARTVTFRQGSGGATRATITPNETTRHIMFQRAASAAGAVTRYAKVFWKNANGALSLLGASVKLTADLAGRIRIGVAASVNDTATITNRLAAPAGVTFVDDNVAQNVPGTDLAAGSAIGVWIEQALLANDAAQKSTHTTQLAGTST